MGQPPQAAIDAAKRIAERARKEITPRLLALSGRALYSPIDTLTGESPFYFLGYNPGETPGGDQFHDLLTIEGDLRRMENGEVDLHGYLDERWKDQPPGRAPIQVRGQALFSILAGTREGGGRLLRRTPTSNLILCRSRDGASLPGITGLPQTDVTLNYWKFHRAVLNEIPCDVIITHAVDLARALAKGLGLGEGYKRPSGWGGSLSNCYSWKLPEGPVLLAIPNLSRYSPDGAREHALRAFFEEFIPASALQLARA